MERLFKNNLSADKLLFEEIYRTHHSAVYSNIFKLIKDSSIAEDILQEVFLSLWENRLKIDKTKTVSGWLFVVSYNKSLNFLKMKLKASISYIDDNRLYKQLPDNNEIADEELTAIQLKYLEEAVSKLSPQKQKVFRLCKYEGKSLDETSQILGLSRESVKDYLKRSKKFIRKYIVTKQAMNSMVAVYVFYMLNNL